MNMKLAEDDFDSLQVINSEFYRRLKSPEAIPLSKDVRNTDNRLLTKEATEEKFY